MRDLPSVLGLSTALCLLAAGPGAGCRGERPPPEAVTPAAGPGHDPGVAREAAPPDPIERPPDADAPPADAEPTGVVHVEPPSDGEPGASGAADDADGPVPIEPAGGPFALRVDGYEPAAAVPPSPACPTPAPLIVILHGNFDRPEWQCATWGSVGSQHGRLLCPRGSRRTDVDASLDRWTWDGPEAAARETAAAVRALRAAADGTMPAGAAGPAGVREDGAILVGFSLGARYAPAVAATDTGVRFGSLVLVEQGFAVTTEEVRAAVAAGVERVVYVCGERTECRMRSEAASARWRRAGAAVELLVMEGVGHEYPGDFDPLAERVFGLLAVGALGRAAADPPPDRRSPRIDCGGRTSYNEGSGRDPLRSGGSGGGTT
jgi:predicted esterase